MAQPHRLSQAGTGGHRAPEPARREMSVSSVWPCGRVPLACRSMTWLGIETEVGRSLERAANREAAQSMLRRGVNLASVPLMAARSDLLRLVRDLENTEIVLTRRGWPVAALMSKRRWHALHRIIENQADALAAHRCIPSTDAERFVRSDGKGRFDTRLSPDAAETLHTLNGSLSETVTGHLLQLALYADVRGSERIERRPHFRSARRGHFRIVWRIDGELVTVVRIVPLVQRPGAT